MGTGLTVTSWCCVSLTVLCFSASRAAKKKKPSSLPSARHFGSGAVECRRRRDAVGVRGEADKHHKALWWWSERECRSHTFNKGWCSLSHKFIRTTYSETLPTTSKHKNTDSLTHTLIYTKWQTRILNPAEPPTLTNKNGQLGEQRLLLLNAACTIQPPQV